MKKIFNLAFTVVLAAITMVSCEKESLVYDGAALGHFTEASNSFFVEAEDTLYTIPVGLTKAADQDITFKVQVVGEGTTGEAGVHYTLVSDEVTIKAGEVIGNLTVIGHFDNLTNPVKLKLELAESDKAASFLQTYDLTIQQFCPFVRDEFVGTYIFESDWWTEGVPYEVSAIAHPENANAIIFKDMYEEGYDITIVFNDATKSNFFVTIAQQPAWFNPTYGDIYLYGGTTGKFDACNKSINFTIIHGVPGLGTFGGSDTPSSLVKID